VKKGKFLKHIFSLIMVAGLAVAAYKYLDIHLMVKAWKKFSWSSLVVLLALPLGYMIAKSWRFLLLMRAADPEVEAGPVVRGFVASQALSLLPVGFAARSAMLTQAGIPAERSVGPVLANSFTDQFVLLVSGLFLAVWYPKLRMASLVLTAILAVSGLALRYEPSRAKILGMLEWLAVKVKQEEKLEEFLVACGAMASLSLMARTLTLSVLANLASYGILCVVVRSLGFEAEYWPLGAAFVIPNLLGRMSPLPAGAGVTEAGMVGFMAETTAMNASQAAAAVALMRLFDVVVPALYGGIVYLFAWRGEKEDAGAAPPGATPAAVADGAGHSDPGRDARAGHSNTPPVAVAG
jgi:uncharacterized protein (TIRG00374 family)